MLSTGSLDRRISIERNTPTQSRTGALEPAWERIGRVRWARRAQLAGQERYTAQQFLAREQVTFTVRWAEDLEGLSPKDRIVYPVVDDPADNQIYDVLAVHELGYREGLVIETARRAEA